MNQWFCFFLYLFLIFELFFICDYLSIIIHNIKKFFIFENLTNTMRFSILEFTLIIFTGVKSQFSISTNNIIFPFSFINLSIFKIKLTFAMSNIIMPVSLINFSICILHYAKSISLIVCNQSVVRSSIFKFIISSVFLVFIESAFKNFSILISFFSISIFQI